MTSDHVPWEQKVSDTESKGISVDLANAFSTFSKRQIKIVWLEQEDLFKALADNRVDCILSSVAITDEYKDLYAMSDPYTKMYPIMLIRNEAPILSKVELNRESSKIAVISTTMTERFTKSEYSNAAIQSFSSRSSAIAALLSSKCDVLIDDPLSVFHLNQLYPKETRINPAPLTDKFQYYSVYAAQNNDTLIDQWNVFFTNCRNTEFFDALNEKHVSPFQSIMDEFQIEIDL
jgi:ABC-type amino acid transport substrate-binding protein